MGHGKYIMIVCVCVIVGTQDGRNVSVATNGNRVADIRPLGRIHTVQVEVEPSNDDAAIQGDPAQGEGNASPPAPEDDPATREDTASPSSQIPTDPVTPPPQAQSTQPPTLPPTSETQLPGPVAGARMPAALASESGAYGVERLSPLSLPAVAEGLQEAGKRAASNSKKSKKVKPLSTKDLLPLHQDVGRSNKQLLEPMTPEFQPTPEWVTFLCTT